MARDSSEQRRAAARLDPGRRQAPQGVRSGPPAPKKTGTAEQPAQQQRAGRNRPFAPGEDGESH